MIQLKMMCRGCPLQVLASGRSAGCVRTGVAETFGCLGAVDVAATTTTTRRHQPLFAAEHRTHASH